MKASVVIVTTGDRPAALARAISSVDAQRGAEIDRILVANGAEAEAAAGWRVVRLEHNVGPAAARNRAVAQATGDVAFFLDDDASYPDEGLVARALDRFRVEPQLGILSFRIDNPEGRTHQRRHVPRLRAGDPTRSSEVTTFLEGACAIRAEAFARAGGYPEAFFFGHEGTDLAWRAIDAGYRVRYAGDLVVNHPAEPPTRHGDFHRLTARNRVLVARRLLPLPLKVIYVSVWVILGLARARSSRALRDLVSGFREGLGMPVERRPISWRAVWRMTRAGRPPVV